MTSIRPSPGNRMLAGRSRSRAVQAGGIPVIVFFGVRIGRVLALRPVRLEWSFCFCFCLFYPKSP